ACLAESPDRPLVLVLGSSRVQMGLCAGSVNAEWDGRPALVFNFGLSGGGALLESLCLRRLLDEGLRPDVLVLEVLPPTLNQPGAPRVGGGWLEGARLRAGEAELLHRYHTDARRSLWQWTRGRGLPCFWNHGNVRSFVALDGGGFEAGPERVRDAMDA